MANQRDGDTLGYSYLRSGNPEENLQALVEHEDLFVERDQEIRKAVESTFDDYGMQNAHSQIYHNIQIAISASDITNDYDEEDWDSLGDAILGYIHGLILMEAGVIEKVAEYDPSPALQHFLINSMLEFGPEVQRMNFHKTQGKNWWSFIRTDRVLNEDSIKHKHMITVDRRQEVEIDSSPYSDWVLIEHLLSEALDAIDIVENPNSVTNIEYLNEIRGHVYFIEEVLERLDEDIGLIDREEIVSEVNSALDEHGEMS